MRRFIQHIQHTGGYSLIEVLVAVAILSMVIVVITSSFLAAFHGVLNAKYRIAATGVATELLERIRNMPYDDIGTTTGWPTGNILATQIITQSGTVFTASLRVDYIDDPFDGNVTGTIPDKPLDTVPTDYKRAEVSVGWDSTNDPVVLTARFAPNGLETEINTGSLLITVFNASGQPVPLADVHVTNTNLDPAVDITNTTDINGNLQLLSLPPDVQGYHVVVSKTGYNNDGTQPITVENPQPTKADATIEIQKATEVFFAIDKTSTLNVSILSQSCVAIPDFEFTLQGEKKIGDNPQILKYNVDHQVDASGQLTLPTLEWDNYDILLVTTGYDIAGYSPPNALSILPNTTIDWRLILAPHTTHSLLLNVLDSSNDLPITGATVHLTGNGFDESLVTGRGFLEQSDWSGGSGQETIGALDQYQSDDGNIDSTSTTGQISLAEQTVVNAWQESFDTTTRKDEAATTADWDTSLGQAHLISSGSIYDPTGIVQSLTLNSTPQLFTTATLTAVYNDAGQTIIYYLTADGTTYEEVTPGVEHTFASPGDDMRFKIELATANSSVTPTVESVSINAGGKQYAQNSILTSSTFDTGDTSIFTALSWNPVAQTADVGAESVRFQLSSNNDNATWNYVGPDGTASTYYAISNSEISSNHDGNQYIRYRMYLQTQNRAFSPIVSSVSIGHTSQCTPPGQVFFSSLVSGTYTIDISHLDYEEYSTTVDVDGTISSQLKVTPL